MSWEIRLTNDFHGIISSDGVDVWEFSLGDEDELYLDSYDREDMDAGMLQCDTVCRGSVGVLNLMSKGWLIADELGNIYVNPILPHHSQLMWGDSLRACIKDLLSGDVERRTNALWEFQRQYDKVTVAPDTDTPVDEWGAEHLMWKDLIGFGYLIHKYQVYLEDDKLYVRHSDGTSLNIDIRVLIIALDYNKHTVKWLPGVTTCHM